MTSMASPAVNVERRTDFRSFAGLCLTMALVKLAIQIVGNILSQHAGYGIFRDEMYYLILGHHLAFGYVDEPPLIALVARFTQALFGLRHMWTLRLLPAIAGAAKVYLTGVLVWALGGTRKAAALAMLGVTVAGVYLAIDGFLSMNAFEPLCWMLCLLALIRIVHEQNVPAYENATRDNSTRDKVARFWWIVFGISAGLGLENKVSEVFFLAALLLALLLTTQRRILASRWFAVAVAITVALAMPYLLWELRHDWATLHLLTNISHSNKDVKLPPLAFIGAQIMLLTPWTVALWATGIVWLLVARRARPYRFLGVLYLVFLAIMMFLHGKSYYLAPIYPIYFAPGAMCILPDSRDGITRRALVGAYALLLVVGFVLTLPFSIPVLPPQQLLAWMRIMHYTSAETETHAATPLPQLYADRLGWHEMVQKVAHIYNSLPPDQRAVTGILTDNYGEASAINLFGPQYGLPVAISGHQAYWLWGPQGYTGQEMILITDETLADLAPYYASCTVEAQLDNPLAMPWEHKPICLCRDRVRPYAADWKDFQHYY